MAALSKQQNIAVNTNKSQVFFEDSANPLSYNYKTDQWTAIPDYAGIGFYSVESGVNIGLVRTSSTAVDLQQPDTSDPHLEAIITTGEASFSDGTRRIITGVRPLLTGADANVALLYRDLLNQSPQSNYLLWNQDLSNAAWTKTNTTITTNVSTLAPDGTQTVDLVAGDGTGSEFSVSQTSQTHADNSAISIWFYYRYVDCQYIRVTYDIANNYFVTIDMQNGSYGGFRNDAPGIYSFGSIKLWIGDWYLYQLRFNSTETTTDLKISMVDSSNNDLTDTSLSFMVWGGVITTGTQTNFYVTKTEGTVSTGSLFQTPEGEPNSRTGIVPFRNDSRFHRLRCRVPAEAGFTTIMGADVEFQPSGEI